MDKSLFKKFLLPGILVACATFSGLIFTLTSRQSTLFLAETTPSQEGTVQRLLTNERKELAIRHVGVSIILSVASGIATIEMLRRWYKFQTKIQEKLQQFEVTQHFVTTEEVATPSFLANDFLDSEKDTALPETFNLDLPPTIVLDESSDVAVLAPQAEPTSWNDVAFFRSPVFNAVTSNSAASHSQTEGVVAERHSFAQNGSRSVAQPSIEMPILELQPPYQTHRVTLPGSSRYQFAILFDDQSYCLVKLEKTRENALKVAALLADLHQRVIMTNTKRGYAIWTWQAQANQKFVL
ncbi:hypothetical protein ACKFKF_00185 [Phormidesmis sp. 146-12]